MNTIKTWTPDKIQQLQEFVNQKFNAQKISEVLGLTKSAIQSKCHELKLSLNYHSKIIRWTPENISRIIELNNLKKTRMEIATEFGCSVPVISSKLSQLKIRSKNVSFFTNDDEEKLRNMFNDGYSINHIAKLLNRSAPFLCRKAQAFGLISTRSNLIREQLALKKEGKQRCYKCKNIYPYTDEYFRSKSLCRTCGTIHRKGRYESLRNNLTIEQLIKLRCNQAYQRSCKKGWEFDITPEYLMEIYNKQNGLCYYSGIKMEIALKGYSTNNYTLSIDRIDSTIGYLSSNIVLCCDAVNTMKMQMETNEFLKICKKIVDYKKV